MVDVKISISVGELFDRRSILALKLDHTSDPRRRDHARDELSALESICDGIHQDDIADLISNLTQVNRQLWDIEDRLRQLEAEKNFGHEFVESARQVYVLNDRRASIKSQINEVRASRIRDFKVYDLT